MTTITKNTDLNDGRSNTLNVWETCAASASGVVVYTGNYAAACSFEDGDTFIPIDADGICAVHGETLCCDQVVIHIPNNDQFVWILQTNAGNYVLAVAS